VSGKKEGENTFTGIVLGNGDLKYNQSLDAGLYGFKNGLINFYFNEESRFYMGDDSASFYLDADDNGNNSVLKITTKNFLLNTEEPAIHIFSNSINERIRLGKIYEDKYGLDIYEGSLWIYGCP
jgi:hypothetical protein